MEEGGGGWRVEEGEGARCTVGLTNKIEAKKQRQEKLVYTHTPTERITAEQE